MQFVSWSESNLWKELNGKDYQPWGSVNNYPSFVLVYSNLNAISIKSTLKYGNT